jgi:O-antigen/teichoic acid export membrane protein
VSGSDVPGAGAPSEGQGTDGGGTENLRRTTLQGGAYLAVREVIGMVVRVLGVIIVTRKIGPHSYGIYAGAAAFVVVVASIAQMGMEVYLIRQTEVPTRETYDDVFTFLVALSVVAVSLSFVLSMLVDHLRPSAAGSVQVFRLMLISVPLNVLWAPAQARIERAFGFKRMAWLELSGDAILYAVAVPLALAGFGPYSLTVGFIAWQGWLLVGSYRMARMMPRLRRPTARWFDFLRHGIVYSTTTWIYAVAGLANPVIVGRYFGATGVGYVALAARLVDTLGFGQRATWRLGLVALSRVQTEGVRIRRGIEEGMVIQVLAVAIPIGGVAVCGTWLIPFVFGAQWLPAVSVFVLLGAARVLNAPLTVQMAFVFSRGRNAVVAVAGLVNLVVLVVYVLVLVPVWGVDGFGVATIVGTLAWLLVTWQTYRLQAFDWYRPIPWLCAVVPPILSPLLPWPQRIVLLAPLGLLAVVPSMRHQLVEYAGMVSRRVRRT